MSRAEPAKSAPVEPRRFEVVDGHGRSPTQKHALQKHALVARKLQALYAPAPALPEPFRVLLQRLDHIRPASGQDPPRKPGST